MILSTSCVGAGMIFVSVDYFVDASRASTYVYDRLAAHMSTSALCWYSWLIIAAWPLLATASVLIQFCLTGAKFDHREKPQGMYDLGMYRIAIFKIQPEQDISGYQTNYPAGTGTRYLNTCCIGLVVTRLWRERTQVRIALRTKVCVFTKITAIHIFGHGLHTDCSA